jgi:hypothetical protein
MNTDPDYVLDITIKSTSSTQSLTTCDLTSQPRFAPLSNKERPLVTSVPDGREPAPEPSGYPTSRGTTLNSSAPSQTMSIGKWGSRTCSLLGSALSTVQPRSRAIVTAHAAVTSASGWCSWIASIAALRVASMCASRTCG